MFEHPSDFTKRRRPHLGVGALMMIALIPWLSACGCSERDLTGDADAEDTSHDDAGDGTDGISDVATEDILEDEPDAPDPCDSGDPLVISDGIRVSTRDSDKLDSSIVWTGSVFGVAWADHSASGSEVFMARFNEEGEKQGVDTQITTLGEGRARLPSLMWTGDDFGLVWQANYGGEELIAFQRVDSTGSAIGSTVFLSDRTDMVPSTNPSAVWTGSVYGVVWTERASDFTHQVHFTSVSAAGAPSGTVNQVTEGSGEASGRTPLTWTGSEYGLVWNSSDGMNMQVAFTRIGADGTREGGEVFLSDSPFYSSHPMIAWTGSEYAVTWWDSGESPPGEYFASAHLTRLTPDGVEMSEERTISPDTLLVRSPKPAWTGSAFGCAWEQVTSDSSSVFLHRFDPTGIGIGDPALLSDAGFDAYVESIGWTGSTFGVTWRDVRHSPEECPGPGCEFQTYLGIAHVCE